MMNFWISVVERRSKFPFVRHFLNVFVLRNCFKQWFELMRAFLDWLIHPVHDSVAFESIFYNFQYFHAWDSYSWPSRRTYPPIRWWHQHLHSTSHTRNRSPAPSRVHELTATMTPYRHKMFKPKSSLTHITPVEYSTQPWSLWKTILLHETLRQFHFE